MIRPLDTHGLDTWHLPTPCAKSIMLALLRQEAKDYEFMAERPAQHVYAIIEWLDSVPTRGDA